MLTYLYHQRFGLLYYIPQWGQLITGFLIADVFMYWWHRANHQVPFFWRFHSFHHTDKKLNTTSSVRFHAVELLLSYVFKVPVFAILGISPLTITVYGLIFLPVVILHHSNIRISKTVDKILRMFIVSPGMHRIHHSITKFETNSNYSSVLPYWDTLFKSYVPKSQKPIVFGI